MYICTKITFHPIKTGKTNLYTTFDNGVWRRKFKETKTEWNIYF